MLTIIAKLKNIQRKAEKRYIYIYLPLIRLPENPGMATMAAALRTETDSSRWGLLSNRFNIGDLVVFSLFLVISGRSSVCIESTARCIQCILIAHNMLHKDQQVFSMDQHQVIPQWYHEGFKIQG